VLLAKYPEREKEKQENALVSKPGRTGKTKQRSTLRKELGILRAEREGVWLR